MKCHNFLTHKGLKEYLHQVREDRKTKGDYGTPCLTNHTQVRSGRFTLENSTECGIFTFQIGRTIQTKCD